MTETTQEPMDYPKHPYGTYPTPPRCSHVHRKHGACLRWDDHPGGHYWENAPRPWWLIVLYIILAAIASWWLIGRAAGQTQITPRQIRGLASVVVMKCAGVTSPGDPNATPPIPSSDCTGLYYVDIVAADGTELKIIGAAPPPGVTIDPAHWSVIP